MKKVIVLLAALLLSVAALSAVDTKTISVKEGVKAGVVLGYPTGLTAGWRISEAVELNVVAATHYDDIVIGAAPLFTIVNLEIAGQFFPLSIGPAAYLSIGFWDGIELDLLGDVRLEYTFAEIPLNLFLEAGLGITLDFDGSSFIRPQGSGALGVRYVF